MHRGEDWAEDMAWNLSSLSHGALHDSRDLGREAVARTDVCLRQLPVSRYLRPAERKLSL